MEWRIVGARTVLFHFSFGGSGFARLCSVLTTSTVCKSNARTQEDEAFVSSGLASASGVVFAGAHRHNIDGHDVGRTYRYAVDTSGDINLVCEFTPPSLLMSDAKFGVGVAYNGGDLLIVSASRASFGLLFEGAVYIYKVQYALFRNARAAYHHHLPPPQPPRSCFTHFDLRQCRRLTTAPAV